MTEALDNAEAALSAARVAQWNRVMPEPVTLMNALEALASEHRRLLAELDEAHAHFQVQEGRIRALRADTELEYGQGTKPSDDERESLVRVLAQKRMHTNESLGKQYADADAVLAWMRENGYEKRETGSCWDQGPTLPVADGECPPTPPLCELPAGHLGAHREGHMQWIRREPVVVDDAMADRLIDIVWSSPNRIAARTALRAALTPDGQRGDQ